MIILKPLDLANNDFSSFSWSDLFGGSRRGGDASSRGSDLLYEMKVSFMEAALGTKKDITLDVVSSCDECGGIVKPDVVLYEEGLDDRTINNSVNAIANADVLIIGGTSLVVYPAAGLINYFRGSKLVLINKSRTSADSKADLVINDDISKVLKIAVDNI